MASGYRLRRMVKTIDGLPEGIDLLFHLNRIVRIDEVTLNEGKKPRPVTLVMSASPSPSLSSREFTYGACRAACRVVFSSTRSLPRDSSQERRGGPLKVTLRFLARGASMALLLMLVRYYSKR